MEKFVIIDGNSLINRAFYALPPMNSGAGVPTQGVYGFVTMLVKAIGDIKPDYLAVAFDLPQPTFRHLKYKEYKAQRKKMPDELAVQLPILKDLLKKMGIMIVERAGFEADDVIGTMAKRADCKTFIITGDRDALQLIDEKITVMLTRKGLSEISSVDEGVLLRDFSLTPKQVVDYKALCGDTSDNIPGVEGVGDKTAISLLGRFKSLDSVYENIGEVQGKLNERLQSGKESAYLSQYLAAIDINVPIDVSEKDCRFDFPFDSGVKLNFIELGFKSIIKREDLFKAESGASAAVTGGKPLCNVLVVKDLTELDNILCNSNIKRIAFDVGLSVNFAFNSTTEYAVNLAYSLFDQGLDYVQVLERFKRIFADGNIQKILFDYKGLKKQPVLDSFEIVNYIDVKLLQYLTDMSVNYETLTDLLSSYGADTHEPSTGLIHISSTLMTEIEKLDMHRLYYDIELPLTDILYKMERRGFRIDIQKLNELGAEFLKKQEELAGKVYELTGTTFNINSPKQLAKVLFEDMAIPYPTKSKTYSTSAEILEQLEADYPVVRCVLGYRFYAKLLGTYVEGLKKVADAKGNVRTEFKQTLTTTGRLSSVEPNLQNIPIRQEEGRMLRAAFVPKEGNILISADYSQIELRLMAHFSRDPILCNAFLNGVDIHTSTAAEVFNVPRSEVTPAMRREAKAVNFGIIYGISDFGLAASLGIATYKAKEYILKYFERFSLVKKYIDSSVELAKQKGYASTVLNRVRKIPELYSSNYNLRKFGERVAMNMPLQGSAADIIKIAMIDVEHALQGMKSKLILQVHDELIIDADKDEMEQVKQIIKDKMENAVKLAVPLTVEIGVGANWYECK